MRMVYKVLAQDLPKATKEMNFSESFFSSTVVDILLITEKECLVVLDVQGDYPYITNKWKELIIEER